MLDELVDLVEGAVVQQCVDALASGQRAGFVLAGDGALSSGMKSLVSVRPKLIDARLSAQDCSLFSFVGLDS
jgi:hypothetical protein